MPTSNNHCEEDQGTCGGSEESTCHVRVAVSINNTFLTVIYTYNKRHTPTCIFKDDCISGWFTPQRGRDPQLSCLELGMLLPIQTMP